MSLKSVRRPCILGPDVLISSCAAHVYWLSALPPGQIIHVYIFQQCALKLVLVMSVLVVSVSVTAAPPSCAAQVCKKNLAMVYGIPR